MNTAEQIFRSYFETDEDYLAFKLAHDVKVEVGKWGPFQPDIQTLETGPDSIEDKPSSVVVYGVANARNEYCITWSHNHVIHRPSMNGPAEIIKFRNGALREWYYENGKRVKRPK